MNIGIDAIDGLIDRDGGSPSEQQLHYQDANESSSMWLSNAVVSSINASLMILTTSAVLIHTPNEAITESITPDMIAMQLCYADLCFVENDGGDTQSSQVMDSDYVKMAECWTFCKILENSRQPPSCSLPMPPRCIPTSIQITQLMSLANGWIVL